jgi:hypothetical protein
MASSKLSDSSDNSSLEEQQHVSFSGCCCSSLNNPNHQLQTFFALGLPFDSFWVDCGKSLRKGTQTANAMIVPEVQFRKVV